jgi:predicted DNA binding CopG/RHH family protein
MTNKIAGTDDAWDEGELGRSEEHAVAASHDMQAAMEACLGMQAISIRLPKQMIDAYKLIGAHHGIGYQPLMRDILQRFVPEGMREVLVHHARKATEATESLEKAGFAPEPIPTDPMPSFKKAA